MEDNEIIAVLRKMQEKKGLSEKEREALSGAVGALTLMVHTSESHLKHLKKKHDRFTAVD